MKIPSKQITKKSILLNFSQLPSGALAPQFANNFNFPSYNMVGENLKRFFSIIPIFSFLSLPSFINSVPNLLHKCPISRLRITKILLPTMKSSQNQ